jgi:D-glycero-D-manno-heptose 1,7-bisphosphate phosphatase
MIITGRKNYSKMSLNKRFDTLFLDRDGVFNKKIDDGYVLELSQIEIIPGIKEFLEAAERSFDKIIVVSNQRCIGRGLLSVEKLGVINDRINHLTGGHIDRFYVCPHLDEDNCSCRKPKTGLFIQAQNDYNINFEESWMVGDSESDMIPAKQLGITTFFISGQKSAFADHNIADFAELKAFLEETG